MNRPVESLLPIRAAVLRQPGRPLKIERLQMEGPRDDEVLVRLVASGICHTDIDFCEGGASGAVVLGHEGSGVVEQVGKTVKGVKPGDHVVLSYQSCGHCQPCQDGHPADCRRFWEANFGFARLDGSNALRASGVRGHFFGQSSFATHTLVTERNLVKVPKTLPLALLAPLGCGLQTGAGTVMNSLAVKAGSSLAIFGTGSVGLAAVMAARIVGAGTIIGVDLNPRRLALARELGATHQIDNRNTDLVESIAAITGGGVDHVMETTGALCELAVDVLNPRGKAAFLTGASGRDQRAESAVLPLEPRILPIQHVVQHPHQVWRSGTECQLLNRRQNLLLGHRMAGRHLDHGGPHGDRTPCSPGDWGNRLGRDRYHRGPLVQGLADLLQAGFDWGLLVKQGFARGDKLPEDVGLHGERL